MKKKILAIVTARGNSKGLKNKNLQIINKKPLIYFPIKAALKSKKITKVIISTDSNKIANKAEKYGAEVPFLRPKHLALDNSSSFVVIKHALNFLKKNNETYDNFILLEPTSPFTTTEDIDNAISILNKNQKAESIVGVSKIENSHPLFSCSINRKGFIKPFSGKNFKTVRRQTISNLYFFNGSLYLSDVKAYLHKKSFYHNKTLPYVMPKYKSFEVDDFLDLMIMKTIFTIKNSKNIL